MNDKEYAPLSPQCVRNLNDKLYEKRKTGALEVERLVREYVIANEPVKIRRILKILGEDFALSNHPNARKGGAIGLAATAIGLGKESQHYVRELVQPVLASFHDPDSRVRYYACEALYNIVKVCRGNVLPYFNEIFDGISKLMSDTDQNVKNGTELLDRLIKDIVTESPSFDLMAFMPLLRDRIYAKNPEARQFIVSWLAILDAVPDINMIVLLPEFLDGLFNILGDSNLEIRKMCQDLLTEFLTGVKNSNAGVKYEGMANILIIHCNSADDLIQFTAMTWLREFIGQAGRTMIQYTPGIINAVLPNLQGSSDKQRNVAEAAKSLNDALKDLVSDTDDIPSLEEVKGQGSEKLSEEMTNNLSSSSQLDVREVITVICQILGRGNFGTKIAALEWLSHMLTKVPKRTFQYVDRFFPVLLQTLSDESEEVVLLDLEALAEISSNPAGLQKKPPPSTSPSKSKPHDHPENCGGLNEYFSKFMACLVELFKKDRQLLEPDERGYFIIRQLCQLLTAEDIFKSFSHIIVDEPDVGFACKIVQTLNTILLTSTELFELRTQLKNLDTQGSCALFCCLYKSWCHSPIATISLCYLTQNYHHASDLLQAFGDLEITVDFLKEIDKLVQLIESPIFSYLRLQLLDVQHNQDLIRSLYSLLMLLPQSEAFKLLRNRLDCIPQYQLMAIKDKPQSSKDPRPLVSKINFKDLHQHFLQVQARHRAARSQKVKAAVRA
ncbi:protein VAC14 homolog [Saccostrea echinata]|uniref:protein VAC14 homolog n=1 Tax=Saccostrea echinata TaxID=191078 RepID=UPI002A82B54E|nr:protein VAC14 homolog [Saccostrea echinata]